MPNRQNTHERRQDRHGLAHLLLFIWFLSLVTLRLIAVANDGRLEYWHPDILAGFIGVYAVWYLVYTGRPWAIVLIKWLCVLWFVVSVAQWVFHRDLLSLAFAMLNVYLFWLLLFSVHVRSLVAYQRRRRRQAQRGEGKELPKLSGGSTGALGPDRD